MTLCFICNNTHTENNYKKCDEIISLMINNFKNKIFENICDIKGAIKTIPIKKFKCEKCNKELSSKENYLYHVENNVCKKINKCDKCDKIFYDKRALKYHISKNVCEKQNSTTISNNTTNNITNNTANTANTANTTNIQNQQNIQNQNVVINVNSTNDLEKVVEMIPFRNASYKISTKKYLEYANNPEQAIKKFVKDEHLNPDKPERMNILNTNPRSNRVQLFDFDEDFICRWQTKNKTDIAELLFDRGVNILFFAKTMLSAAGIKLDPKKETQLNAKIKEYESDEKLKKKYVDMITDLTYDYRDIVETNKKRYDNLIKN